MADLRKRLEVRISALVQGAKNVLGLSRDIDELQDNASAQVPDPTSRMRGGVSQTQGVVRELGAELTRLIGLGALLKFAKDSARAATEARASFLGLKSIAEFAGVGIGDAFQRARDLTTDGLLDITSASRSLQNLLSRGFTLDESVEVIERLKDAAAFNRQAHLSMAEAVKTATEGLKNENSILVDNAGVTKNVSILWKEYAEEIDKGVGSLTQAEKVTAEYLGILRETEGQIGNAALAAEGLAGAEAELAKASNELKVAFGSSLTPAFTQLARGGSFLLRNVIGPFLKQIELLTIRSATLGRVLAAAVTFNVDRMRASMEAADDAIADVVKRYEQGLTPTAVQAGESQRDLTRHLKEGAAAARDNATATTQASSQIAGALQDEVQAHADALAAATTATRERERLAAGFAATLERINTGPEVDPEDLGYLDIAKAIQQARDEINQGDFGGAAEGADRARALIEKLAEAGNLTQTTLRNLLEQARQVATQAGGALENRQAQAVDTAAARIKRLVEDSKALQNIAVSINQEQATQQAEAVKAAMVRVFASGIDVPVNVVGPGAAAATDAAAVADAATRRGGRG